MSLHKKSSPNLPVGTRGLPVLSCAHLWAFHHTLQCPGLFTLWVGCQPAPASTLSLGALGSACEEEIGVKKASTVFQHPFLSVSIKAMSTSCQANVKKFLSRKCQPTMGSWLPEGKANLTEQWTLFRSPEKLSKHSPTCVVTAVITGTDPQGRRSKEEISWKQ